MSCDSWNFEASCCVLVTIHPTVVWLLEFLKKYTAKMKTYLKMNANKQINNILLEILLMYKSVWFVILYCTLI